MKGSAEKMEIDRRELLRLAAADSIFYGRTFFPRTIRQKSPDFHRNYWYHFEDQTCDFFGAEIFRGGAKTTLTRVGISKRIAYAISRNILSVAISEGMASHTVRWLKRQVETNTYWSETFMLRKGSKWTDDWIEIINVPFDCIITVMAKGMTSGLRGLNPDEWRPDFIQCDDVCDDENVGTPEQREKTNKLIFGALVPTLAPKSEAPHRKFVMNQTCLNAEDVISMAHKDPSFRTMKYPKLYFDKNGVPHSAWPERWSVQEVLEEQEAYFRRRQGHIWYREFGCKIVGKETSTFDLDWLRYWTALPIDLEYYIGVDPTRPANPESQQQMKKAHKCACAVIGVSRKTGDTFLVEYISQKGKNPDEIWTWLVTAIRRYHPKKIGVETIAFQKMLAWYFRKKMDEDKFYFRIEEIEDKRSKADRIGQAYTGLASNGKFWVHENHTEFTSTFGTWVDEDWDLGDAGAQAIRLANPWMMYPTGSIEGESEEVLMPDERDIPALDFEGGAP